jgi:hypothetical protein
MLLFICQVAIFMGRTSTSAPTHLQQFMLRVFTPFRLPPTATLCCAHL